MLVAHRRCLLSPLSLLCLLLLLSIGAHAQPAPTRAAVTYATLGSNALRFDYYAPSTGTGPRPLVIWLHDGGWLSGNRALPTFAAPLLNRGIAIAAIDYRLTTEAGQYGSAGVNFPAQINDVKGAIRFLRAHATEFNLDPTRFGVWGSSAGGHLAALAATSGNSNELDGDVGGNLGVSSRVQAAVDYYGPIDLLTLTTDVTTPPGSIVDHDGIGAPGSLLIGFNASGQGIGVLRTNANNARAPYPNYLALARAASPLNFVDALDPPTYIVHGTADPQVAIRQSERLRDALNNVGVNTTYVTVPGGVHGEFSSAVHQGAIDFLANTLLAPVMPIGAPLALNGAWYELATSGQGFEFQWLAGDILLVFFYGHRDDGSNLFLIGTRSGRLRYGETISLDMTVARGGRFNGFDATAIRRERWGSLNLRFDRCDLADATLIGSDGTKSLRLVPLIKIAGTGCD